MPFQMLHFIFPFKNLCISSLNEASPPVLHVFHILQLLPMIFAYDFFWTIVFSFPFPSSPSSITAWKKRTKNVYSIFGAFFHPSTHRAGPQGSGGATFRKKMGERETNFRQQKNHVCIISFFCLDTTLLLLLLMLSLAPDDQQHFFLLFVAPCCWTGPDDGCFFSNVA